MEFVLPQRNERTNKINDIGTKGETNEVNNRIRWLNGTDIGIDCNWMR